MTRGGAGGSVELGTHSNTSWPRLARPTPFAERLLQLAVKVSSKFRLHSSSTSNRVVLFKREGIDLVR